MNTKKYISCSFENCAKPHRRNGYCANHSQKFKRGTLYTAPFSKICEKEFCFQKHYSKGFCLKHFKQLKRKQIKDLNSSFRSKYEIGNINFTYKEHSSWAKAVKRFYKFDICFICNWSLAPCEVHHIHPKSKGGLSTLYNAAILCPNCHKLADIGKLEQNYLQNITNNKINSILEELKEN